MQRVCATKDDFCSILQKYIALKIGLNLVNSTFVPSTKSPVPGSNRIMEIGIDSFAAMMSGNEESAISDAVAMEQLLDRIVFADQVGLDYFGIGEHHRKGFLDSAPTLILAAAAALTKKIRLGTAVTVLSAADPVRVFQSHATLDLISKGRAEMVAGRGSFIDAYPLFGLDLNDYDALFIEKLDLLLKIRDNETITWSGKFRPALRNQAIYPRPLQDPFPIWLGVGGTPESFVRAGTLGLPLMVAIIGGETHRFRPLVDLYREAGRRAGHAPEKLKVGLHSLAYVGASTEKAFEEFYPGYAAAMTKIGKERGWPPTTRAHFEAQAGPRGALLVGSAEDVATKILRHAEALGGISRVTFQLDTAELPHQKIKDCIGLMGNQLKPLLQ
jgi:probable LLM family oxidoreductase